MTNFCQSFVVGNQFNVWFIFFHDYLPFLIILWYVYGKQNYKYIYIYIYIYISEGIWMSIKLCSFNTMANGGAICRDGFGGMKRRGARRWEEVCHDIFLECCQIGLFLEEG